MADAPPATQYEMARDAAASKIVDLDKTQIEEAATQKLERTRTSTAQNRAADSGVILKVEAINFMCHEHLTVELGPLINFIVGENGSGKSAVLTAVTLCLGGKASSTNRGTSLKSMIKSGAEQAILKVHMKNEGTDAYQPDLYGDVITVERHFSQSGTSGFKLKSSSGRIISSKKGDVEDYTEHCSLQVDNPMNILTQDTAKKFIQTSTPAQKYVFFHEGVQLKQLDNDYSLLYENCEKIEEVLKDSSGGIADAKKRFEEAKARHELVKKYDHIKQRARVLLWQVAWAQVEAVEADLVRKERALTAVQDDLVHAEQDAETKGLSYDNINGRMEEQQRVIEELEQELAPLQEDETNAKAAVDAAHAELQKAHETQRLIHDDLKDKQRRVASTNDAINAETARLEAANGDGPARVQAAISAAEGDITNARGRLHEHESKLPQLESEKRVAKEVLGKAGGPIDAKGREIEQSEQLLQRLNNDRGDKMAGFDRNMPRLLEMIRRDNGFLEKPVGPIGLHVVLKHPEWSKLLETVLNTVLDTFIVTSQPDLQRLQKMMRQLNVRPNIFVGSHNQINTSNHEPDPQFLTILRALDIDNDLVRNQLIIHNSIEQILLIPKRADAISAMHSGSRPKNAKACYALHDSDYNKGHNLGYTASGNSTIGPVFCKTARPKMTTNVDSQIAQEKAALDHLRQEKKNLEADRQRLQAAVKSCEQALKRHSDTTRNMKAALQRAEAEVERLQEELSQFDVDEGQLDYLKKTLIDQEREVVLFEDQIGAQGLEKVKLNEVRSEKKNILNAKTAAVAEHNTRVKKASNKLKNFKDARQIAVVEKNAALEAIDSLRARITHAETSRDAAKAVVQEFTDGANNVHERVPVENDETVESLEIKLKRLKDQIKAHRAKIGASDEEILAALEAAHETYTNLKENYDSARTLSQLLKQTLGKRLQLYNYFRSAITTRSRINFNYLLYERQFRGKLKIDHRKKLLVVKVEPDLMVKKGKGRETKTLSGGEKSFSSTCLLLALWEAMGSPIRCLDEYDVFMDDVNRDVSSRLLVSTQCFPQIQSFY